MQLTVNAEVKALHAEIGRLRALLKQAFVAIEIERIHDDLITDEQLDISICASDAIAKELKQHENE